jgi:PAS domain S-box-containing protein
MNGRVQPGAACLRGRHFRKRVALLQRSEEAENVRILVVDDYRENRLALRSILTRPEYEVVEAASGEDALRFVLEHDFAVVLLDVMMPLMNGFETARFIRSREASKDVPIIFLTANDSEPDAIAQGYSSGAVDYLVKPLNPHIVSAKVAVFADLFRREQRILRREAQLRTAERERGETALRESEAVYEAIFKRAPVGIAHTATDGRWLRVNDKFCHLIGYSSDEILKLRFQDVTCHDDLESDLAARAKMLGGELESYRREKRYIRKDGKLIWVTVTVSLARTFSDREPHFITVVEDITEWKLDQERRQFLTVASEALLSSFDCEATLGTVARLALPMLADWCVVDVTVDDVASKELVVAHADPDKVELVRQLRRRLFDDPATSPSKVLRTRESELNVVVRGSLVAGRMLDADALEAVDKVGLESSMVVPLVARGHVLGTITLARGDRGRRYGAADLAMAEDLAHRVAFALDNARLYRDAQAAIRARDEFLSIASHELRTPITTLQLQADGFLRRLEGASSDAPSPEGLRLQLQRSRKQLGRLAGLVDDLLDVSRISGGVLRLSEQHMDLRELIDEVVARFGEAARRAECEIRIFAERDVTGRWDPGRLDQVLTNLLSNALKFAPGQPIEVMVEVHADRARLGVSDHGPGIASKDQERIFDRFERTEVAHNLGGLGLGLWIAREIVRAHGGEIVVDSAPGAGAAFWIELPLSTDDEK